MAQGCCTTHLSLLAHPGEPLRRLFACTEGVVQRAKHPLHGACGSGAAVARRRGLSKGSYEGYGHGEATTMPQCVIAVDLPRLGTGDRQSSRVCGASCDFKGGRPLLGFWAASIVSQQRSS